MNRRRIVSTFGGAIALLWVTACGGADPADPTPVQSATAVDSAPGPSVDSGLAPDAETVHTDAGLPLDSAPDTGVDTGAPDAGADVLEDASDAGDAGVLDCLVVTGYSCAVAGHPYPARCEGLACCCAAPPPASMAR